MPLVTACHTAGAASCVLLAPKMLGSAADAAPPKVPGGTALLAAKKVPFSHTPSEARGELPGSGTDAGDAQEQLPGRPAVEKAGVAATSINNTVPAVSRLQGTTLGMLCLLDSSCRLLFSCCLLPAAWERNNCNRSMGIRGSSRRYSSRDAGIRVMQRFEDSRCCRLCRRPSADPPISHHDYYLDASLKSSMRKSQQRPRSVAF